MRNKPIIELKKINLKEGGSITLRFFDSNMITLNNYQVNFINADEEGSAGRFEPKTGEFTFSTYMSNLDKYELNDAILTISVYKVTKPELVGTLPRGREREAFNEMASWEIKIPWASASYNIILQDLAV